MIKTISVKTSARTEMVDVTTLVERELAGTGISEGRITLYVPHTTAAITINEGADPAVKADVEETLARLFPESGAYRHAEGNSDAHLKSIVIGPSETVPLEKGRLRLGRWQSVFLCEFDGPRTRTVEVYIISEQAF
jgi:secondary thiamine-phosphate synthase enzyme